MMLKRFAVLFVCAGSTCFAGLVDHGDYTGFPNVNCEAHLAKIARTYFPEIATPLSKGLPRKKAWTQDVQKVAAGFKINSDMLAKFTNFVLNPRDSEIVSAPHPALLEFELYARGTKELFFRKNSDMVPSWKKLLGMPLEKRRYTTIPVYYAFYRSQSFLQKFTPEELYEEAFKNIQTSLKQGCVDTQGCFLALVEDVFNFPELSNDPVLTFKHMFRKQFATGFKQKTWRYTNEMDLFSRSYGREDRLNNGDELYDIIYYISSLNTPEGKRKLENYCAVDPALRDLIVAVGLTNRDLKIVREVAFKYARQSKLNYPVLALRLPLKEAKELLKDHPEHHNLRDLLTIKSLNGESKIKAIDEYIAKYPDYTPEDMPKTSVALNTHMELNALAGTELFKLGRYHEAAERWLKGCTPEDLGLIAEQIMSIDELMKFCDKHFPVAVEKEQSVFSLHCAKNNKLLYPVFVDKDQMNYFMRNLLARRLMRAGRYAEAGKYFTGTKTKVIYAKFNTLHKIINSETASRKEKYYATLNMASLYRSKGKFLTGTFLEPDNLICDNDYSCKWGTNVKNLKLNKPELPRWNYLYTAAEFYSSAADLTDDRTQKGYALWTAGTLLKKNNPKAADKYFKKLYRVMPELTVKNWFKREKDVPWQLNEFSNRTFHAENISTVVLTPPEIRKVTLPKSGYTKEELFACGEKLLRERYNDDKNEKTDQAAYAFYLAGNMGLAKADIWNSMIQYVIYNDYEAALWFLRRAEKKDPSSNLFKHELGHVYSELGYWKAGFDLIRQVADTEKEDPELLGIAAENMNRIYSNGYMGQPKNEKLAEKYGKIASKAAEDLRKKRDSEKE